MLDLKYKYTTDNTFLRNLYASMSTVLNGILKFEMIEDDTNKRIVNVPIYVSATGQQRFLQYYFNDRNYITCDEHKVEGSFDVVPRGVLQIAGSSIDSNSNTNPFSRVDVYKEDSDGKIKSYNANLFNIPLNLSFNLEIMTNTHNEQMMVWQNLISSFYFTRKFYFKQEGVITPAQITFPDNLEQNKLFEYRSGDKKDTLMIRVPLQVEAYLPITTDEKFNGGIFKTFINTYDLGNDLERTEKTYIGTIKGSYTIENELQRPERIVLKLKNINDSEVEYTTTLTDGYFFFENVPARKDYYIVDDAGNTVKNKINLLPNQVYDINSSYVLY